MIKRICAFPHNGKYYLSQEFDGDLLEQRQNHITPTITGEWRMLTRCYFSNCSTLEDFSEAVYCMEDAYGYEHIPVLANDTLPYIEELWMLIEKKLVLTARYQHTTTARTPFYLNKHVGPDGNEYIRAQDLFASWSEKDPQARKAYEFLRIVEDQQNYYTKHHTELVGNPRYALLEGLVAGYCKAMGWEWTETENEIRIVNKKRTVFVIQKPQLQFERGVLDVPLKLMNNP